MKLKLPNGAIFKIVFLEIVKGSITVGVHVDAVALQVVDLRLLFIKPSDGILSAPLKNDRASLSLISVFNGISVKILWPYMYHTYVAMYLPLQLCEMLVCFCLALWGCLLNIPLAQIIFESFLDKKLYA